MSKIIKHKIKINRFNFANNIFKIYSDDNICFGSFIKKGSVCFSIFNSLNEEVNLSCLECNQLITIYADNNIDKKLEHNKEKNIIIIKKIKIKNNYVFNSDSSSDEIIY
jgi:hypothetical protein